MAKKFLGDALECLKRSGWTITPPDEDNLAASKNAWQTKRGSIKKDRTSSSLFETNLFSDVFITKLVAALNTRSYKASNRVKQ